jgi:thymidylate kinase
MSEFVIVIEGCDKTGKSTMAAQLSAMLEIPVKKFGQPGPEGAAAEYHRALDGTPGSFICDRFHLGESVYGPIYRKVAPMNQFDVRAIENKLLKRGCLLVLMEDSPERIIERFKQHNEDFARGDDVHRIVAEFERVYLQSRLSKIHIILHPAAPSVVANIVRLATWREQFAAEAAAEAAAKEKDPA